MTHRTLLRAALAAFLAFPLFAPPGAVAKQNSASKVLATVNGVAIPQRFANVLIHERVLRGEPDNPQIRNALKQELINRELLTQAAQHAGIPAQPDVRVQIALARQAVIVEAYLRNWLQKHPVTEADVKRQYDRTKAHAGSVEYHVQHILVRTDAEAKKLIAELDNGASFSKLAKKYSIDKGSKENGGDLGWYVPSALDPTFATAMAKLKVGDYTETPVHTRFGYHIIRLDGERPVKFPKLEKIQGHIRQQLVQQKIQNLIYKLRTKANITQ